MVEAFVSVLWSETVQEAFIRYYFRAVTNESLTQAVPELDWFCSTPARCF